jgi:nucleotide-binding universal stress UspA family protein
MGRKILVPVDLGDHSLTVLTTAKSIAGARDEIILLHVVLDPSRFAGLYVPHFSTDNTREELMEDARERLVRFRNRHARNAPCFLRFGVPYREILDVSKEEGADLIVIGKRESSGVMEHLFVPGTFKHVLLKAECEVKTVPLPVEGLEELRARAGM